MDERKISYESIVDMWKGFQVENSVQLDAYLNNFAVLFAYNSGSIENVEITYHDTREIFENGKVVNFTGNLKTLYEIENMRQAHKLMVEWYDNRVPMTQERIKEMHRLLTNGTYDERRWELGERPGEYKKNDIWVIGKNELAAPVDEIESEMEDILEQIGDIEDEHALTAAGWFHLRFEGIHAFADGNGRVGRALMNYYLIQHNHPPIIIYEENKREYYDALDHFDDTGDIKPMIGFLKNQACKTWEATYLRHERVRDREQTKDVSLEESMCGSDLSLVEAEVTGAREQQVEKPDSPPIYDDPRR